MESKILLIAFDFDGVIANSRKIHAEAFIKSANKYGFNINEEIHAKEYDGLSTNQKLVKLLGSKEHELYNDIYEYKQALSTEILLQTDLTIPQNLFLLKYLKKLGYRLICVSNCNRKNLDLSLRQSGCNNIFERTFSSSDVRNPKPAPDIYFLALKSFDIESERCLVVEDSPKGIEAAQKSGIPYLAIDNEYDLFPRMVNKLCL